MTAPAQPTIDTDPILEAIVRGVLTDCMLQNDPRFTASAIAQWMNDPANQARLQNVQKAFNYQTELIAAQSRSEMILALVSLAKNPETGGETVRKACSEVLRLSSAALRRALSGSDDAGTCEAVDAPQHTGAAAAESPVNSPTHGKQADARPDHPMPGAPQNNGHAVSKSPPSPSTPQENDRPMPSTAPPTHVKPPREVPRIPVPPRSR